MPIGSVGIMYEFGASAIFGAATKTYLDWKNHSCDPACKDCSAKRKQGKLKVLCVAFIANSIFAFFIGSHVADLFVTTLPEWSAFGKAVAYLSGAVAINIMSGLLAVNWKEVILSKIRGEK